MPTIDRSNLIAGAMGGLAGGAAFAAAMKLDIKLSGEPVDDFQLLAGFGPTRDHWQIAGPIVHAVNSVAVGTVYSMVNERLPGPGWMRGLTFAMIENTVLWPVIIVLDQVHPAIKSGELPTFNRPWPFIAENIRHAAFGIVLGAIHERTSNR